MNKDKVTIEELATYAHLEPNIIYLSINGKTIIDRRTFWQKIWNFITRT